MAYNVDVDTVSSALGASSYSNGGVLVLDLYRHAFNQSSSNWFVHACSGGDYGKKSVDVLVELAANLERKWSHDVVERVFSDFWASIAFQENWSITIDRDVTDLMMFKLGLFHKPDASASDRKAWNEKVSEYVSSNSLPKVKKFLEDNEVPIELRSKKIFFEDYSPSPGYKKYLQESLERIVNGAVYDREHSGAL
ncbi:MULTISPECIES: hypothetical protein [Halomonadaceae]|uniref:hypothetical protein n=1 Tax=Halomonadaceae TaxID=28256 RepID=UPI0015828CD1|nr:MULTISPECIES: hypothetical protein [Halomonas]MDI4637452.1 hypothetical protein [Halomonas sp. BMC7]NUJ61286.1 hypothetical protein [Halomonas taeanensis]|tara:strand:+ start:27722 stop:28306 length:585 start_codon:yes stop_codon:yes gene_type:complete